ncbi:MAG: DEAD/DEAH box helicase [Desulfosarcina sp.]|nr:DEAD/DEAH box helicase [Desulfosarcina sp.]MBC2744181.1 DEAD/DEAH box helicase [Desulfosarcina sp.]MBC2767090.1 DEAD/DEAH box helicase [Desulfosarcina sp.]
MDDNNDNHGENFEPGTIVRLKSDPGRVGVITGRTRQRAGKTLWQVRFPEGAEYQRDSYLEVISAQDYDPLDLLGQGKFGRAKDLRGGITHIRLTGRLANLIYSMDTTNTDFYAYQFKPVLNFLDAPGNGLLVADEVGLGKTIEAGLIWTELRSRFDIRRVMVLCPAMLREKWKTELRRRFGIDGDILGASEVLEQIQDYRLGERLEYAMICSMQGLRPRRGWSKDDGGQDAASTLARMMDDSQYEEPLFDLLIVDEAHYLRNPESMTSKLGRLLRSVSEHVVLLSATPVHLRSADLYQLLNLVDEDTFNQPHVFEEILQANEPLVRARDQILAGNIDQVQLLTMLAAAKETPYFENNRQIQGIIDSPPSEADLLDRKYRTVLADRLESINLLGRLVNRTRKRDVTEWRVVREVVAEVVPMSSEERGFYKLVTELIRNYALQYDGPEGFLLVTPQRQMSSSMPAALEQWLRRGSVDDEQLYEDLGFNNGNNRPDLGPLTRVLVENAHEMGNLNTIRANDSKYNRLKEMLTRYLNQHPKEKIVLFSYFRPTLRYLSRRLEADGISSVVLMGGQGIDKNDILDQFQKADGPSVLLSSEVASEGVDLQFSRLLVNYDLPWNPMKVEQRIGRIDRLGQQSPTITIWNLLYADTIDERIYTRLYERLGIFEQALGGLEAILGDQIRKLTDDLLTGNLTAEQEESRIEQTEQAISILLNLDERLENEAVDLVAHGDYILNQVKAARELQRNISSEDIWNYIYDFFVREYQGSEFLQLKADELEFKVKLSAQAKFDLDQFLTKAHLRGKTRLGSVYPSTVRCIFQNQVADRRPGLVETINQMHPLVRFVSDRIGASDFSYYSPVSVSLEHEQMPELPRGVYAFVVERWSVLGIRAIEKLHVSVNTLGNSQEFLPEDIGEKLITVSARSGRDWLQPTTKVQTADLHEHVEQCQENAENSYDRFIRRIEAENNDRADVQEKALKRHLERQLEKLNAILQRQIGNEKIARMTKGRITAMKSRVDQKLREIQERRILKHHKKEICIGIVQIY